MKLGTAKPKTLFILFDLVGANRRRLYRQYVNRRMMISYNFLLGGKATCPSTWFDSTLLHGTISTSSNLERNLEWNRISLTIPRASLLEFPHWSFPVHTALITCILTFQEIGDMGGIYWLPLLIRARAHRRNANRWLPVSGYRTYPIVELCRIRPTLDKLRLGKLLKFPKQRFVSCDWG